MHASAGTKYAEDKNKKVLVSGVENAIRLGADAISVHVNVGGSATEHDMLEALGEVADLCDRNGMPLLAMTYPRGKGVTGSPAEIAHSARISGELSVDIVKCPYNGDIRSMTLVMAACPVPAVIAGGPKCDTDTAAPQMVEGPIYCTSAMARSIGHSSYCRHASARSVPGASRAGVSDCRISRTPEGSN
jgi:DhnA family fructose-bisphosphate aldolase class Ia